MALARVVLSLACVLSSAMAQHDFTAIAEAKPAKLSACYWQFRSDQREVLGWSIDMTIGVLALDVERLWIGHAQRQRQALLQFGRVVVASKEVTRPVLGFCGTMLALLDSRLPIEALQRFPGLDAEIAAEAAAVRERRVAEPRFVSSWDPATRSIDWSFWQPEGIAAADEDLQGLFLAAVYCRHADGEHAPEFAAWLARAMQQDADLGEAMARLHVLQQTGQLLMGPPAVGLFEAGSPRGTLVPRYLPREAPAVTSMLRHWLLGEAAPAAGGELRFAAAGLDDSVRGALLATFDAVMQQPDVALARRSCAAVYGYVGLRESDVIETARGPVTGSLPLPPRVYVEPHLEMLAHADLACQRMQAVYASMGSNDDVERVGWRRQLFASLRRCIEAERQGGFGSREDMDEVLDSWKSSDSNLDGSSAGVTIRPVVEDASMPPGIKLRRDGFVPATGRVSIDGRQREVWTALARCSFVDADGKWQPWAGVTATAAPSQAPDGGR